MIRVANQGDAASIAALTTQLGYPATTADMRPRLAFALASALDAVYVAEGPGSAIEGWVHVIERRLLETPPFCEIMGLVVDESARGCGVGAALVQAAERWAIGRGIASMRVRSNLVRERAHAFYRDHGYEEAKRQAVFNKRLTQPGKVEPDHVA